MSSDKEFMDEKSNVKGAHTSAKKNHKPHRTFWRSTSPKKETFHTIVVNYGSNKNRHCQTKRCSSWTRMVSALNAKKQNQNDEEDVYDLRNLYEISLDDLNTQKSISTPIVCDPQCSLMTSSRLCCHKKLNDESCHGIKVFKMPSHQTGNEDCTRKYVTKLSLENIGRPIQSDCSRKDHSTRLYKSVETVSGPSNVKVEIFNMPPAKEEKAEIINHNFGKVLSQDVDIIVLSSDDDEDIKPLTITPKLSSDMITANIKPDIIHALQKLAKVAQSTSELCTSATKSTQKPEGRFEIPTQTVHQILAEQKSIQMPSFTKSMPKANIPTLKQRQLELHRLRVLVEKKRLRLLDIKIQRERDEIRRENLLFQKELQARNKFMESSL